MSMIALSIVMAITVEGLVELGKSIGKAALDGDRKTAATQLAALIISCALCMAAGADVYDALGVSFANHCHRQIILLCESSYRPRKVDCT